MKTDKNHYRCKKIFDTHVHIGGGNLGFDMTEDMVVTMLDRYNVDHILLSNCDCCEVDFDQKILPDKLQITQSDGLERTLKLARLYPDRISVAPFIKASTEGLTRDYRKLIEDNLDIIKAIKIHPYHGDISPVDKRVIPYLELAEEHNLCVVSHTGGCEKASPVQVYEAAKMFKNVNFVMVHMGLGTDNKEALDLLGKCDNLYGDTTWVPMSTTIEAIKRYGSKKMMFGSDAPIDGTDTYLHNRTNDRSIYQDYFYVLPDLISENDYDDLMYKNAERVFKLRIEE